MTEQHEDRPTASRIPLGIDTNGKLLTWAPGITSPGGPDVLEIAEEINALHEAMQARLSKPGTTGKAAALGFLQQLAWAGRIESSVPPYLRLARRIFRDAWWKAAAAPPVPPDGEPAP